MFIYICNDHDGYYPVGVASVVLADSPEQARQLLDKALIELKLNPFSDEPYTLKMVNPNHSQAIVVCDGNYEE